MKDKESCQNNGQKWSKNGNKSKQVGVVTIDDDCGISCFQFFFGESAFEIVLKKDYKLDSIVITLKIYGNYLMYKQISDRPTHFLSACMVVLNSSFSVFTVLGIYKFGSLIAHMPPI